MSQNRICGSTTRQGWGGNLKVDDWRDRFNMEVGIYFLQHREEGKRKGRQYVALAKSQCRSVRGGVKK